MYTFSLVQLAPYVNESRQVFHINHLAGAIVEFVENGLELLVLEKGFEDPFKDDYAQLHFGDRALKHVKYHEAWLTSHSLLQYHEIESIGGTNLNLAVLGHLKGRMTVYTFSLVHLAPYVHERPLRILQLILHPAGARVELLENGLELLVLEEGFEDPFEDDYAQPLVEDGPLEHVEDHEEAGPRGLRAHHSPQVV